MYVYLVSRELYSKYSIREKRIYKGFQIFQNNLRLFILISTFINSSFSIALLTFSICIIVVRIENFNKLRAALEAGQQLFNQKHPLDGREAIKTAHPNVMELKQRYLSTY